jgi:hypothetical protein
MLVCFSVDKGFGRFLRKVVNGGRDLGISPFLGINRRIFRLKCSFNLSGGIVENTYIRD